MIVKRWRELIETRCQEAVNAILAVDGVVDVVIGGSVGRGEPWPLSDIDLLPVIVGQVEDVVARVEVVRAELVDWWAASGRAQTLDVGWLAFTTDEVDEIAGSGPAAAVARVGQARWLHGTDKAVGGRGAVRAGPADTFAGWATETRAHPDVRAARARVWLDRAQSALEQATNALRVGTADEAAAHAQGIGPLAIALIEAWSEREGGMARSTTRFEKIAAARQCGGLAAQLAQVTGSSVEEVGARAHDLPAWLQTRVELAFAARRAVGEDVTWAENLRDQVLAFQWLAPRRTSVRSGQWAVRRVPFEPADLVERAVEVDRTIREVIRRALGSES